MAEILFDTPHTGGSDILEGADPPDPLGFASILFWEPVLPGGDITFGLTGQEEPLIVTADLSATFPKPTFDSEAGTVLEGTLAATFSMPTMYSDLLYDNSVFRGIVRGPTDTWQVGDPTSKLADTAFEQAIKLRAEKVVRYQDGIKLRVEPKFVYQFGEPIRIWKEGVWQDGIKLQTRPLSANFDHGIPTPKRSGALWQDGVPSATRPLRADWDRAIELRRAPHEVIWHWALRLEAQEIAEALQTGARCLFVLGTRYQEAMKPPYGRYTRPPAPTEPPEAPCFTPVPGNAADALFLEAITFNNHVLFQCFIPSAPGAVIIPLQRRYLVYNQILVQRDDTLATIDVTELSFKMDVSSWALGFSMQVLPSSRDLVVPNTGTPVIVRATINGMVVKAVVESMSEDVSFGRRSLRVSGRGIVAELDDPYHPKQNYESPTNPITAQQACLDALQFTGWSLSWNLTDWTLPGGAWSFNGTPIQAVKRLAEAAGGYVYGDLSLKTLHVQHKYPFAPWDWGTLVLPEVSLPASFLTSLGTSRRDAPNYDAIYVSGEGYGNIASVKKQGTAGTFHKDMVVDNFLTELEGYRQRGRAELSETGSMLEVQLAAPLPDSNSFLGLGKLIEFPDNGVQRLGLVRSVSVTVRDTVRQQAGVIVHV